MSAPRRKGSMQYILMLVLMFLIGCGPTGQVKVERHIVCNDQGQECQTVETQKYEPTATDRWWQILLLLAIANGL